MSLKRFLYRSGQFWRHTRWVVVEQAEARSVLTPKQMALFLRMQKGEQAHSLEVLHKLSRQGETDPDLQAAALLHDFGKVCFPLRIWERVWIVVARKALPRRFQKWGASQGELSALPWWQRACAVAEQHPAWGAELAQSVGCSARTVALIRRHQDKSPLDPQDLEDRLLVRLQAVDDQS
jgi:hypothetical protein